MMRKTIACLCLSLSMLLSMPGQAADYLKQSYDLALITTFMVLDYDACVKQGLIDGDGKGSAAQRFQDAITRSRADKTQDLPAGVTNDQVADSMQQALDAGTAAAAKNPLQADAKKCDSVRDHWPKFAKQSGLE